MAGLSERGVYSNQDVNVAPLAETDEGPVGEEFRLGTFELRTGSNYSGGEQ